VLPAVAAVSLSCFPGLLPAWLPALPPPASALPTLLVLNVYSQQEVLVTCSNKNKYSNIIYCKYLYYIRKMRRLRVNPQPLLAPRGGGGGARPGRGARPFHTPLFRCRSVSSLMSALSVLPARRASRSATAAALGRLAATILDSSSRISFLLLKAVC